MVGAKLKIQKVNHMTETQTIGDISNNPSEEKNPAGMHHPALKMLFHHDKHREGNGRKDNKKQITIMKHAEGCPRIIDMGERKESGNHRNGFLKWDEVEN